MAKSINVSGRMSVERFNDEFQKAFGVRCNVKISKWVNADGKATLASIRPKDFKGPSKVDLSIVGNMTVGTLKKRFEENFGVMIELYIGRKIAPDNVTIGAIREGRAKVSKGEKQKETAPKTTKPDKPNITDELNDTPEPDKPSTQTGEKMTDITIEIFYEEHQNIVNIINFSTNQKIDALNFNASDYENLINNNDDFIKEVNKAVIESDAWQFDYNQENSEKLDLAFMKKAVEHDSIMLRITKIGDRDLSFLSINNEYADKTAEHEQFLKGTIYECDISDEEFEDSFNEFISTNALLALEYIFTL